MSAADDLNKLIDRLEDENVKHAKVVDEEELRHEREVDSIVAELNDLPQQFKDELEESEGEQR